jgi:hypothetical protein
MLNHRTVRRVLLELTTKGYVRVEMRRRADRSRTSNGYRLGCGDPPDKMSWGTDMYVRGLRTTVSRVADSDVLPLPTIYPLSNPRPPLQAGPGEAGNDARSDAGGGRDWQFPEGLSAGQIDVLRGVLTELRRSQVQPVLDELAGRMKIARITNPIRYCAALVERIKRGQFTPELGIRIAERRAAERQYSEQRNARSNVDRATLEATMHRLPDDLRASLERMRKRDQNERSTTTCRDRKSDPES